VMPNSVFMDRLQYIIVGMMGVTVVAFILVAYVVCNIYEKRNKDE